MPPTRPQDSATDEPMNISRLATISRPPSIVSGISPAWVAFIGSALLSLIAIATSGTLNRDGMLYIDAAYAFQQDGYDAAHQVYPWPFLSILIATVSQISGLGLETAGYLLNIAFTAGACALLVACVTRLFPEAIWLVVVVLLAFPGLNDYRHELLREYGCWFFTMLAFWLALRWADVPRWATALAVQFSLIAAALFRPEALALFPALLFWQVFENRGAARWRGLVMLGSLPAIGFGAMLVLYALGQLPARLTGDLSRFNLERFNATAQAITAALPPLARENGSTILFLGSLAIIPAKLVNMMGIFIVPTLYALRSESLKRLGLLGWAFIAHLLVLVVFVIDQHFLAGRYIATLFLFIAPLAGYGLYVLLQRRPRWKVPVVCLTMLVALTNVVSTSEGKQYFVDAGKWLSQHVARENPRIYNESARAAYYAGWRYKANATSHDRSPLAQAIERHEVDLVILEISHKDADFQKWFASTGLRQVQRFEHSSGDAIVVAAPRDTTPHR